MRSLTRMTLLASAALLLALPAAAAEGETPAAAVAAPATSGTVAPGEQNHLTVGLGVEALDLTGAGTYLLPFSNLETHMLATMDLLRIFEGDAWLGVGFTFEGLSEAEGADDAPYHDFRLRYLSPGSWEGAIWSSRFTRNLRHLEMAPSSGEAPVPRYVSTDLDPGKAYEKDLAEMGAMVKVRLPAYPAHLRLEVQESRTQGTVQQFLLNESCESSCHVLGTSRELDTLNRELTLGADAHAGLVDLSLTVWSHTFQDENPDPAFAFSAVDGLRPAGTYSHHLQPETETASQQLLLSTNLTGRLAGILGVGILSRENTDISLKEELARVDGEFVWRPDAAWSVVLKGRRTEREQEASAGVEASRAAGNLPLEPSSTEQLLTATVNWLPLREIRLRGDASRRSVEREDMEGWSLPGETVTDQWGITALARPSSTLRISGGYRQKTSDNPPYPSAPTAWRKMDILADWSLNPRTRLEGSYARVAAENSLAGRDSEREWFHNGVTVSPFADLSVQLSYDHFIDSAAADLSFGEGPGLVVDYDAPYRSEGNQYLLSASWKVRPGLSLTGEINHLTLDGALSTEAVPYQGLAAYTSFQAVQQGVGLGLSWTVGKGWDLSTRARWSEYDDQVADSQDEEISLLSATLSRSW